tara:strand:+ start:10148 stop:10432 length:285 start_codon:yes stop_codon:yes gene_type:complete
MFKKLKDLMSGGTSRKQVMSEKEKATAEGKPFVKVVDVKFDEKNPGDGYFELEWNKHFVTKLEEAGYSGKDENETVDAWFTTLCRGIAEDESAS